MFRKRSVCVSAAAAALLFALALPPRVASAKDSKAIQSNVDILSPTSLGGKQIKPGSYKVIVDGSTVEMKSGKKIVAEAPAQWKSSNSKAHYSFIVTNPSGIKEIHFHGKSRYIEVED